MNVLVSLLDSAHVHHELASQWFHRVAVVQGWATNSTTENGFIRVVSNFSYPNLRLTPELAASSLRQFKQAFSDIHQFWVDEVSLTDHKAFDLSVLTGSRQITDAYLAGVAWHRKAKLSTLDGSVPWKAVRGATAKLIERIGAE